MEIAARSAQWVKPAVYSLRRYEYALLKSEQVCPEISTYLTRPSKELELVRLSTVKAETGQPVIAGVNKTALWLRPISCT